MAKTVDEQKDQIKIELKETASPNEDATHDLVPSSLGEPVHGGESGTGQSSLGGSINRERTKRSFIQFIFGSLDRATQLGLVLAFASLALGIYSLCGFNESATKCGWPTTIGAVYEISKGSKYSYPEVFYSYGINGKEYTSHSVVPGRNFLFDQSKYQKGTQVEVHYDPNKPSSAMLEPGNLTEIYGAFVLAVFFMMVAGFILSNYLATRLAEQASD